MYICVEWCLDLIVFVNMASSAPTAGNTANNTGPASFDEWITEWELDDQTKTMLATNGFSSLKSVKLLKDSMIQKHFKGLNIAQTLLLQEAVASIVTPPTPAPATVDNPSTSNQSSGGSAPNASCESQPPRLERQDLDMSSVWRLLDNANGDSQLAQDHPNPQAGKPAMFDPFCFDSNVTTETSKCRDIKDFVTLLQQNDKQVFKMGGVELTIPESKPKLESITPLQYMEASLKILREMAIKDGADLETVLHYCGYLIKIATMGQRFNWQSVLKYDYEYRRYQASNQFQWGADNAYTMMLFLKDSMTKDPAPQQSSRRNSTNTGRFRSRYDPASGRIVCEKFNGRNGCTLPMCKFAHVCLACFSQSHEEFTHRSR